MVDTWCPLLLYFLLSHVFYPLSPARNFKVVSSSSSPHTPAWLASVCCVVVGARGALLNLLRHHWRPRGDDQLRHDILTNSVSLRSAVYCPCFPFPASPFCNPVGRLPPLWQPPNEVVSSSSSLPRRYSGGECSSTLGPTFKCHPHPL